MNAAIKWGVILGVVVGVWGLLLVALGVYENWGLYQGLSIPVFILANIVFLVLALRATRDTNGYGKQLMSALVFGIVGGVVIFILSYLNTAVLFPDAYAEILLTAAERSAETMSNFGVDQAIIDQQIANVQETSPVVSAFQGMLGTLITSVVIGAIVAIFIRKKKA